MHRFDIIYRKSLESLIKRMPHQGVQIFLLDILSDCFSQADGKGGRKGHSEEVELVGGGEHNGQAFSAKIER